MINIKPMLMTIIVLLASCAGDDQDQRASGSYGTGEATEDLDGTIHWKEDKLPPATTQKKADDDPKSDDTNTVDDITPTENEDLDSINEDENADVADLSPAVGVRNLDQIRYSMASVTGVSPNDPGVVAAFSELRGQLPGDNDVRALTPAKISAITKLGAQFCDAAMQNNATRTLLLPGVNFGAAPSNALAVPEEAAGALIAKFWGTNLASRADPMGDISMIANLIEDLKFEQPDAPASTANILMGACTAVISSSPFLIF